jgi:hypothetical protein
MTFEIIGNVDHNRLYCTGSFTKFLTTYVCLSFLSEKYDLNHILDDDYFLDQVCQNESSKAFLLLFQQTIGSRFTLRDVCSFYDGLPYTFDVSALELEQVDHGQPFKHHGILSEETFLTMCRTCITQVDPNRCKFHYSELSIIFLGYIIEKIYSVKMEDLYQQYILDTFSLKSSSFSRVRPPNVAVEDLSDQYDYPAISIQDHGYFCYSNGFYTTLLDQKKLLEGLLHTPIFIMMTDISKARAASPRIMDCLTVELRVVKDDLIYGYEGLSFSGCNIWAYSTKYQKGYLTTTNSEEDAYTIVYGKFGYDVFDKVPEHTEDIYRQFLANSHYDFTEKSIPTEYVGSYRRVMINTKNLDIIFTVGSHFIEIRNPEMIRYPVLYDHGIYRIACKDHMHGTKVGFLQAKSGHHYMSFDGTLYQKIE